MQVHSVVEGPPDGEAVVLSGSIGSNLAMWNPQVPALVDAGYRVVRYDHRGHGRTAVPDGETTLADLGGDVVALLDELGIERAHLVGLSLGGMTGMWLGINAPERLRSLVLCCTSPRMGTPQSWADRARSAHEQGMEAIADGSLQRWFTPGWLAANPQRSREFHHMTAATPAAGYAACCHAIGGMDLVDELPTISVPTLVIAGADDPATPPEGHGRVIADAVPGARLEVVDNAAHLGNVEQPERFTELITAHLAGV